MDVGTILIAIKENDGHCPCKVKDREHTICPCKDYRETGECICGLYQ